jgi:histidine triad (HIT) family protein
MFDYDEKNIFAQIIKGDIPADIVFEDDDFICFKDITAQAPIHLLLIPKNKKITSMIEAQGKDADWLGVMMVLATKIAKIHGLNESGYRLIFNSGKDAGQTVFHLHLHIIGGKRLSGKMV